MNFIEAMKDEQSWVETTNGMTARNTSGNALVDLFGCIGSLRNRSDEDVIKKFSVAYSEDALLAIKMVFYCRDIRGGLGERRIPRVIFSWMAENRTNEMSKNMHLIPEFGRWDDMYIFVGTPLESKMWEIMRQQFVLDVKAMKDGKPISLLAKWAKSVNTHSKESVMLGRKTATAIGLDYRKYQKLLSKMRKYISVTEVSMSSNKWQDIKYENVPSKAMTNYRSAFARHDNEGFTKYIESVSKGDAKINSSTLYPYDIVEKLMYNRNPKETKVLEEQWKSLPNYVDDSNILIMADVSGSMYGRPMATAVGLAIYFAERNTGCFHDHFMTFSYKPKLVKLCGETLSEKIRNAMSAEWNMNTNIERAFNLVLMTALNNNLPQSEMPKSIVIITDMNFDGQHDAQRWDFYSSIKKKFEDAGYTIPNIVFWNANAFNDIYHGKTDYEGMQFYSGQSVSVFKNVIGCIGKTPYEAMVEVLSDERYKCVTI